MCAVDADFAGDVAIDGRFAAPALVRVELLQLLVAHRGEEIFRVARAVEIALGDAHAVDRQMPPAVGARVEPRRLARLDAPHLLLAAAVILPVVGDAQRRHARLVPVGEQHRKRAEAGRERRAHGIVGLVAGLRAIERILLAGAPGRAGRVAVDVMADRERREFLSRLPLGGERGGPAGIAVEAPFLVGEGERAVRAALEQEVAADPEHEQIHVAVAVDVERIGADDVGEELRIGADVERLFLEFERAAGRRLVDEQLAPDSCRRRGTPRESPSRRNRAPPRRRRRRIPTGRRRRCGGQPRPPPRA